MPLLLTLMPVALALMPVALALMFRGPATFGVIWHRGTYHLGLSHIPVT